MRNARQEQLNMPGKQLLRRGLSAFLALMLILSCFPVAANSTEIETEPTEPVTIVDATDPTDATDATDATDGGAVIDDTGDDTVTYDYSADVGKFATVNQNYPYYIPVLDTTPDVGWSGFLYTLEDFSADALLEVTGWKVVTDTYEDLDDAGNVCEKTQITLWYQVNVIEGTVADFADGYWILQNYLNEEDFCEENVMTLTAPPVDPSDPTDPTDPTDPSEPEEETVPSVSGGSGITVSSASGIPKQATVAVQDHSAAVGGTTGLYDIKVLKEDGTEWQPIDEGKTVSISIPVEGDVATITHFLDYAPAIQNNANVQYISLEGAPAEALELLKDAIAASDREGYVAVEIMEDVPIINGYATVSTNSFSIFIADATPVDQKALFLNKGGLLDGETLDSKKSVNGYVKDHNVATSSNNVYDNGIYYIDMTDNFISEGKLRITVAWDGATYSETEYILGFIPMTVHKTKFKLSFTYIPIAEGEATALYDQEMTVSTTGELDNSDGDDKRMAYRDLNLKNYGTNVGDRYIVTVSDGNITAKTELIIANPTHTYNATFTDPNGYLVDFSEKTQPYDFHDDTVVFPAVTAKEGYEFTGWRLREPAGNWPSDDTLYQDGDPLAGHMGNVTFVAQAVAAPYGYKINFTTIYEGEVENMPKSPAVVWKASDTYTYEWSGEPTRNGYELVGWILDPGGLQDKDNKSVTLTGTAGAITTVTIYPTWKGKNDALYTVHHMFATDPNLADSEQIFEERQTIQRYGEIGTVAHVQGFVVEGYKMRDVEEVIITADGNAEVNVYYDFVKYNTIWNDTLNGETTEVAYNYGATINPIEAPTCEGYTFVRWDGYTEGMKMPLNDVTFTAVWKADDDVEYRVNHWFAKPDKAKDELIKNDDFELRQIDTGYGTTGDTTTAQAIQVEGFRSPTDAEIEQAMKSIAGDGSTEVNLYYYREEFTLTWSWIGLDADTNKEVEKTETVSYRYGATIVVKDAPHRTAYSFDKWDGLPEGEIKTMPMRDITVTAIWKAKVFAVYYITGEGTYIPPTEGEYNTDATINTTVPTMLGYSFDGWLDEENNKVEGNTIRLNGDRFLTAKWKINTHTITFDSNGGSNNLVAMEGVAYGTSVDVSRKVPGTRDGYEFVGWASSDVVVSSNKFTMPDSDVHLIAQWDRMTCTLTVICKDPFGNQIGTGTVTVEQGVVYSVANGNAITPPTITDYIAKDPAAIEGTWYGNDEIEVTYVQDDVCYVTVEWDNLVFDYDKRNDWDPTTHSYYIPPQTDGTNKVTVTNHKLSAHPVKVNVSFAHGGNYPTMAALFSRSNTAGGESTLADTLANSTEGNTVTYWLWLWGSLTEAQQANATNMVGNCTVTISTTQGGDSDGA